MCAADQINFPIKFNGELVSEIVLFCFFLFLFSICVYSAFDKLIQKPFHIMISNGFSNGTQQNWISNNWDAYFLLLEIVYEFFVFAMSSDQCYNYTSVYFHPTLSTLYDCMHLHIVRMHEHDLNCLGSIWYVGRGYYVPTCLHFIRKQIALELFQQQQRQQRAVAQIPCRQFW